MCVLAGDARGARAAGCNRGAGDGLHPPREGALSRQFSGSEATVTEQMQAQCLFCMLCTSWNQIGYAV